MDDECHTLTDDDPDLQQSSAFVGSNEHGETVEFEDPHGVAVGVEHVGIIDAVLSCALENDWIHIIKLTCYHVRQRTSRRAPEPGLTGPL